MVARFLRCCYPRKEGALALQAGHFLLTRRRTGRRDRKRDGVEMSVNARRRDNNVGPIGARKKNYHHQKGRDTPCVMRRLVRTSMYASEIS